MPRLPMFRRSSRIPLLALGAALILTVRPALAQDEPNRGLGFRGWGPRVGITSGPDQIHFGLQADFGSIARHVSLAPNIEIGFGDNQRVTALNLDLSYRFFSRWYAWSPYLGAGPSFFIVDTNPEIGSGDTSSDVGLNFVFGLERGFSRGHFFVDGRIGLADAPDFKATIGWTFLKGHKPATGTGTM